MRRCPMAARVPSVLFRPMSTVLNSPVSLMTPATYSVGDFTFECMVYLKESELNSVRITERMSASDSW